MELKNKTILITGGSAGIGLEAAKQFLEIGAKVIITGRTQDKLDNAEKLYPKLIAIKSDVANEEDAILLYKHVEQLGGIDILQQRRCWRNAVKFGHCKRQARTRCSL
jgi:uncharacterized oxidoreductase